MREIQLTQGKAALVDDEDFEGLSVHKWCAYKVRRRWYVVRHSMGTIGHRQLIRMHRVVLDAQSGQMIDHIDGNGLNNQRANLRFCTSSQNGANSRIEGGSSRFKGVYWREKRNKWCAQIGINCERKHLGHFETEAAAALAYNKAAKKYFGEFARLNILAIG